MSRSRLIALLVPVSLLVSLVSTASASASALEYKGCAKVAAGEGGSSNATCTEESAEGGSFAGALFDTSSEVDICLKTSPGLGKFQDSLCKIFGGLKDWAFLPYLDSTTIVGKEPYVLKSIILGTVKTSLTCQTTKAKGATIEGGEPGVGHAEALEYSGCSVGEPAKCEVNSAGLSAKFINTAAVSMELVESTGKTPTKIENNLAPSSGTVFAVLEFKNKGAETCVANKLTAKLTGSTLAGISAQEVDTEKVILTSEPTGKRYLTLGGVEKESKLLLGSNAATLKGAATVEVEVKGGTSSGKTVPSGKVLFGVY